jgi:hypothetical protein
MNWREFCKYYGIEFKESGKSTKRGNIYISCPFCRDESKLLLGLDEQSSRWGCWKNERHRGSNAWFLIQALLSVDESEAKQIAGIESVNTDIAVLQEKLKQLGVSQSESLVTEFPKYELPRGCFKLRPRGKRSRRFIRYLERRGFPPESVERYSLYGCDDAYPFSDRLIIPLFDHRRMIGCTGRSVVGSKLRYYTDPAEATNARLFNTQNASGGGTLFITEGPLDAMTLDWAAHVNNLSASAVPLAGLAWTSRKAAAVRKVAKRYDKTVLLLDASAVSSSLRIQANAPIDLSVGVLPTGVKDANELSASAARRLVNNYLP